MGRRPKSPARRGRRRTRLAPADRRRQLLGVAGELLTRDGVDAVQFAPVAAAAGVTRQLVYKLFPSRQALLLGVLEDFAEELTQRFGRGAARRLPGSLDEVTRVFVEAVCDTIEAKGAGPWHLLDAKGPDGEVARLAGQIKDRLVAPWRARIGVTTGAGEREVATVAHMVVAASRAVLDLWCAGSLSREAAVRDTVRGVAALLGAFTVPNGTRRLRRGAERGLRNPRPSRV